MTWFYILLIVILVIALLMLIPIRLKASYFNGYKCTLIIGFVRIPLHPRKPKKNKKKEKKTEKKQTKPDKEKKNLLKEKGLLWFVQLIKKVADLAHGALNDFFRHIIIKKLMLSINVAGSDAADTAVKYGYYCSVVYPAVGIIAGNVKCKSYGVDISPNFEEKAKSDFKFELETKISLMWFTSFIIKHGLKGFRLMTSLKT